MVTAAPIAAAEPHPRSGSLFADYAELFKPRVTLMVVITAAAGFYLGSLRSSAWFSALDPQVTAAMPAIACTNCHCRGLMPERREPR